VRIISSEFQQKDRNETVATYSSKSSAMTVGSTSISSILWGSKSRIGSWKGNVGKVFGAPDNVAQGGLVVKDELLGLLYSCISGTGDESMVAFNSCSSFSMALIRLSSLE
jgi:hypothetical protein